jgi:hypothetical protein
MADELRNNVRCTVSNTPGTTGNFTIAAAATDGLPFVSGDDGKSFMVWAYEDVGQEFRTGCVYDHGTATLGRGTLEGGSAVNFTSDVVVQVVGTAAWGNRITTALQGLTPGGRLCLTSGTPVPSADETAKSTIYYTPFVSNVIVLWDGVNWVPTKFTEVSCAVPSTVARLFDVFAVLSAGAVTIVAESWDAPTTATITGATNAAPIVFTATNTFTNNDLVWVTGVGGNTNANNPCAVTAASGSAFSGLYTAGNASYTSGGTAYKLNMSRTTAVTLQDGRLCKSGDKTKLYLGTGITGLTSGQTESSTIRRLLANYYNRVALDMYVALSTSGTAPTAQRYNYASAVYPWIMWVQPGISAYDGTAEFIAIPSMTPNGSTSSVGLSLIQQDGATAIGTMYMGLLTGLGSYRPVFTALSRGVVPGVHIAGLTQYDAAGSTIGSPIFTGKVLA